jgi:hypothetical protein
MTVGLNAHGSVEAHRLQHRSDVRTYVADVSAWSLTSRT